MHEKKCMNFPHYFEFEFEIRFMPEFFPIILNVNLYTPFNCYYYVNYVNKGILSPKNVNKGIRLSQLCKGRQHVYVHFRIRSVIVILQKFSM